MQRLVATACIALLVAACGDQPAAPAPSAASDSTPPAPASPAPAPEPTTPVVTAIVNVPEIAGKTQEEVSGVLGDPTGCETVKNGQKCFYTTGETEIVFISGKADWITVEALDSAPFSEEALPLLGIDRTPASFSNANVMRWGTIPGLLEVSIFPAQKGADYAYVKTATP